MKKASLLQCIIGPRLSRMHRRSSSGEDGRMYAPNMMESGSDTVIKWVKLCWSLSYYTSPFLAGLLYRRGYFTLEGGASLARFATNLGSVLLLSWFVRGVGRYRNDDYLQFLEILLAAQANPSEDNRRRLAGYDFEFQAWPVDFRWDSVEDGDSKKKTTKSSRSQKASRIRAMPCDVLSYLMAHSIGCGMVYPGSTAMIGALISPALIDGRSKLYEEHNGKRAKMITRDGNEIDTMFVDRRQTESGNGQFLVICSEGNSGFYEVGCMVTPTEAGYSVLGWNHPGFGGSTGRPFPSQEQNAIDSVIQYAIHELKFPVDKIYLFAWSIGGYAASWAAMNYPDMKGVILDATFDDLVPLAVARMPRSWKTLVTTTVRRYINLNIADQLCQYPGPVLLIRRYRDEMITTEDAYVAASNRGNDLLIKVLQYRYPELVNDVTLPTLKRWCAGGAATQETIYSELSVNDKDIQAKLQDVEEVFPSKFGASLDDGSKVKYAVFLARRYMKDYDSTHCTPLPARFFESPWMHSTRYEEKVQESDD